MRKLIVRYKAPKRETIQMQSVEIHEDGKAKVLVVKAERVGCATAVRQACETARAHIGAAVVWLPPGSEFEVWELEAGDKSPWEPR